MARLQIEFRGARTVVHLGHGETTVGRSNRCTIHLPDPDLAEIHFRIQEKGGKFRLKDDGSGNGTRVNGKVVFAVSLGHGDVIEAGSLRCGFLERKRAAPAAPVETAPPPRVERAPRATAKSSVGKYIALGGLVVVVAVGALLFSRSGNAEAEASALLDEARGNLELAQESASDQSLPDALAALRKIRAAYGRTKAAAAATVLEARAERLEHVFAQLDDADRALRSELSPEAAQGLIREVAPLTDGAPEKVKERIALTIDQLREAQRARAEAAYAKMADSARTFEQGKRFGDARAALTEYQTDDPVCRRRADDERRALDGRIAKGYRGLLRIAAQAGDMDSKIGLLEASRETFRGTPQANDLEVRISALHARKRQAVYIVPPKTVKKATGTDTEQPVESGPYVEPDKVKELVAQRRYAEAASLLRSITRHPVAKLRIEELTMQASLFADLVAKAKAEPAIFQGVLLPDRLGRANMVGADEKGFRVNIDGEARAFTWAQLPAKSFVKVFRQAGFNKPPRLATALFFEDETLIKEAQQSFVAFFESQQAPTTFTRIYAHRQGIDPPDGGFVLFRKEIFTPRARDAILLKERIAKLVKDARRASAKKRDQIWTELEGLGATAVEPLAGSIRARREAVIADLAKSKAFSSSRYAKLFGNELEKRRRAALAFILNPQLYPYPNKSEQAQKQAEALVEKVQDLWERPYPLMLEASAAAKELDAELLALDERLARADPVAEPMYETAVAKVIGGLDVRMIAVPGMGSSLIQYNLA
ncbi:MAG: FHA domain-containing protein, partial [Planctomycetota bacterium]